MSDEKIVTFDMSNHGAGMVHGSVDSAEQYQESVWVSEEDIFIQVVEQDDLDENGEVNTFRF